MASSYTRVLNQEVSYEAAAIIKKTPKVKNDLSNNDNDSSSEMLSR